VSQGSPRLSVGMPVFNGGELFASALKSVLAQSFDDLEVVVSDNASTDRTEAVARDYARRDRRVRYIRQASTLPAMENFRFVLSQARGDFFFWAAHDDHWHPGFAAAGIAVLDVTPAAIGAYGMSRNAIGDTLLYQPPYGLDAADPMQRVRHYLDSNGPDMLIYSVFRRDALDGVPWMKSICPEKAVIMHALCRGALVDCPEMLHHYRLVQKSAEHVVQINQLPAYNTWYSARAFWSIGLAMYRNLPLPAFLRLAPRMMVRQNWHKQLVKSLLLELATPLRRQARR
jgi:glycosyltransferase involved in cell wall biosynthesis